MKKNKTIIKLIITALLIAAAALFVVKLHAWQRERIAQNALHDALRAFQDQQWTEAAANFQKYLAIKGSDKDILYKYARAQLSRRPLKRQYLDSAIRAYRRILINDPGDITAASKMIDLLLKHDLPGEAEMIIRRLYVLASDPHIRLKFAVSKMRQGKLQEAATIAKELITADPTYIEAYEILASVASKSPTLTDKSAEQWCRQCVENNPGSALAQVMLGEQLIKNGNGTAALKKLETANQICASDQAVHLRLARAYLSIQELDKAIKHLDSAAKINSNSFELWQVYADHALATANKNRMEEVAIRGLEVLEPDDWNFMPISVELLIYAGQLEEAHTMVSRYRKAAGWRTTASFLEGLIYYCKGKNTQAVQLWEQAIELGDTSLKTRLNLARALLDQRLPRRAQRVLTRADKDFQSDVQWLVLNGQVNQRLKHDQEAISYFRRAAEIDSDNDFVLKLYFDQALQMMSQDSAAINQSHIKQIMNKLERMNLPQEEKLLLPIKYELACGNLDTCKAKIESMENAGHESTELLFLKAELALKRSEVDQAVSMLSSIKSEEPAFTRAIIRAGEIYEQAGEIDKARQLLQSKLQSVSEETRRLLTAKLAEMLGERANEKHRFELLRREHANSGPDIVLNRQLLSCPQTQDKPKLAQQLIAELRKLEGEAGWRWRVETVHHWLALPNFENRYTQAVRLMDQLIREYPDLASAHILLGRAHEAAGKMNLALKSYDLALEQDPSDIETAIELVRAFLRAGRVDQAGTLSEVYLRRFPGNSLLATITADYYIENDKSEDASRVLQLLLDRNPTDTTLLLKLIQVQIAMNDIPAAERSLTRLLDQLPAAQNLDSCRAAVRLSLAKGDIGKAVDYCNQLLSHPESGHKPYLLRARIFALTGRTSMAMNDLIKATEIDPTDPAGWLELALFYYSIGEVNSGIDAMNKCLEIEPHSPVIRRHACRILLASSKDDHRKRGHQILTSLRIVNPYDTSLALLEARSLFEMRTKKATMKADSIMQKLCRETPMNRQIWTTWAKALAKQNENDKAAQILSQGLLYLPKDPVLISLSNQLSQNSNKRASFESIEAFKSEHPNDAQSAVVMAQELIETDHAVDAKALLEEYLVDCSAQVKPQLETWHAIAAYNSGEVDESEVEFESLLNKYPGNPYVLGERFKILQKQNRMHEIDAYVQAHIGNDRRQKAIFVSVARQLSHQTSGDWEPLATYVAEAMQKVLTDDITVLGMLGALYKKQGKDQQSLAVYEKVVELYPNNVEAINNLAWLKAELNQDYSSALELATQGLGVSDNYANLIDTRGVVQFRMKNYAAAKIDFSRVLELADMGGPLYVSSMFHLGRTLAAMDEHRSAIEKLKEALELNEYAKSLTKNNVDEANRLINLLIGTVDEHEHKNN